MNVPLAIGRPLFKETALQGGDEVAARGQRLGE
jgi:hypothetical protein